MSESWGADPWRKNLSRSRVRAAAFLQANIDTDTIAPALRKSQVGKKIDLQERESDDLSVNFFADWRYDAEDNELPDFILNKSGFREATVILGGNNFGCGSSRGIGGLDDPCFWHPLPHCAQLW